MSETDDAAPLARTSSLRGGGAPSRLNSLADDAPVSIRSGRMASLRASNSYVSSNAATSADPTKVTVRPALRFAPKVRTSSTPPASSRARAASAAVVGGGQVEIASMLAHSLELKNVHQRTTLQDLQRSNAGPIGAKARSSQKSGLSMHAKLQSHLKGLKREGRASKNLLELSWADETQGSVYTPVSLPFVLREEHLSSAVDKGDTKRPSAKYVDEANRNAASMLQMEDEYDDFGRQWFLVQLPNVLPALDKDELERQRPSKDAKKTGKKGKGRNEETNNLLKPYNPSCLPGMPEGKLGRMDVHKSGKVSLWIGDTCFTVNQGSDCNFAQEVAMFMDNNSELIFLGRCHKRMILTPDVDRLVSLTRKS